MGYNPSILSNTLPYSSIESAACFNFSNLVKKIKQKLQKDNPNIVQEELLEKILKNIRTFELNNQTFDFIYLTNQLGGYKWYVKCPKCGRTGYKLYLPQNDGVREHKYYCKKCHKLKNISALMGASKKYKKVYKPLKKLEKIRAMLLRKSMTPIKAQPLLDAYDRIEKELASSPEYRLWKFQKEHAKNVKQEKTEQI